MAAEKIPFEALLDPNGAFIRRSKWIDAVFLATAATAESYTVPDDVHRLILTCPLNFWATSNGVTAAKPTGEVSNGTSAELNPSGFLVQPGDVISLVSDTANCPISIACFTR